MKIGVQAANLVELSPRDNYLLFDINLPVTASTCLGLSTTSENILQANYTRLLALLIPTKPKDAEMESLSYNKVDDNESLISRKLRRFSLCSPPTISNTIKTLLWWGGCTTLLIRINYIWLTT
jgi:hypothetical protein